MVYGGYVHSGGYSYLADTEQLKIQNANLLKHTKDLIGLINQKWKN